MKASKMNQAEDKILDEYLAGKSHLSDAYKNIAMDLPGVDVDASILAASRREVHARPHAAGASRWHKWQMPFSIAAVLVISASLTLTMTEHQKALDEVPPLSAPIVVNEEAKASRRDSLGQNASDKMDAKSSAPAAASSPSRKLEPLEKTKKIAPVVTPPAKQALAKPAQSSATPETETKLGSGNSELRPQAFPPGTSGKIAGAVGTTQADSARQEPIETAKAKVMSAAESSLSPGAEPAAARGATAGSASPPKPAPAPVAAPAPMPAAPPPAVIADLSSDAAQIKPAPAQANVARARTAVIVEKDRAENVAAAAATANKSAPLSESATVAAYSASQTWLAKIEALLREGKTEDAERTLAEFKLRFPNYVVPDSIKEELAKQRAAQSVEPK